MQAGSRSPEELAKSRELQGDQYDTKERRRKGGDTAPAQDETFLIQNSAFGKAAAELRLQLLLRRPSEQLIDLFHQRAWAIVLCYQPVD